MGFFKHLCIPIMPRWLSIESNCDSELVVVLKCRRVLLVVHGSHNGKYLLTEVIKEERKHGFQAIYCCFNDVQFHPHCKKGVWVRHCISYQYSNILSLTHGVIISTLLFSLAFIKLYINTVNSVHFQVHFILFIWWKHMLYHSKSQRIEIILMHFHG